MEVEAKLRQNPLERKTAQRINTAVAILSLVVIFLSFFYLPALDVTPLDIAVLYVFGIAFFIFYLVLPELYLNESIMLVADGMYIAFIMYVAHLAGDFGILVLFLYFVLIIASSMKYTISEFIMVVLLTLQAVTYYMLVWSPFNYQYKTGILTLVVFCILAVSAFVWYFYYKTISERSEHLLTEKKGDYVQSLSSHMAAANQMRFNMMRVTSHEFQTPLAAMRNALTLLQNTKLGALNQNQIEAVTIAAKNTDRLTRLVEDLLNVGRIEAGTWKLILTEVDLTDMVKGLIEDYKPICAARQLTLVANLPPTPLKVKADSNLLRIALKNLIDNATKYTRAGGTITVTLQQALSEIKYVVQDNGIGIKQELLPSLFSEFFRSNEAISTRPNGYGIGLHYTKTIVNQHKGEITVESEEGKGTTFTVHIPNSLLVQPS